MMLSKRAQEEYIQKVLYEGTSFDKIKAWYLYGEEKIPLTDKEKELQRRWDVTFSLLCSFRSTEQCVPILEKSCKISRAQAYRDIAAAKKIFGDITKSSKDAERYILADLQMRAVRKAFEDGDITEVNRGIANLIKIKAFDKEDFDLIDPEKLQKHEYYIVLNIGEKQVKADLTELNKIPISSCSEWLKNISVDITDVEAVEIMNA